MRNSNEQTLKQVINEVIEENHLGARLAEVKVIGNWEELVGRHIAKQTSKIYFMKGRLVLHIDSAPLRHELHYTRAKIVKIVNDFAGEELIEDVMLR